MNVIFKLSFFSLFVLYSSGADSSLNENQHKDVISQGSLKPPKHSIIEVSTKLNSGIYTFFPYIYAFI